MFSDSIQVLLSYRFHTFYLIRFAVIHYRLQLRRVIILPGICKHFDTREETEFRVPEIKTMQGSKDSNFFFTGVVGTVILLITISATTAQNNFNYYQEKPGSCAPALPVQICSQTCFADAHCEGTAKCCSTSCGGTVCARPVTMRRPMPIVKPGSCPSIPTGRWVCTPTCSTDGDCPGARKCCKNRCGATACQKPETAPPVPPMDNSFNPSGEFEERPAPNPYLIYTN